MSTHPLTTAADIDSTDYVRGINRIREIMPDSPRLEAVELYVGALLEQIDSLRASLTASGKALKRARKHVAARARDSSIASWPEINADLEAIDAALEKANG